MSEQLSEQLYFNREISWLEFNSRVLQEACEPLTPCLERLKFLSIFSSNLDEFFMVRVAGIKRARQESLTTSDSPDRKLSADLLQEVRQKCIRLQEACYREFNTKLKVALEESHIEIVSYNCLSEIERRKLSQIFDDTIFPILTPLAVDPAHPFPFLSNLRVYLAIQFKGAPSRHEQPLIGFVEIPKVLPRLLEVSRNTSEFRFIFLEELIIHHLSRLFFGLEVDSVHLIRVTRDLDFTLLENEVTDLLQSVENKIRAREQAAAIRLEYSKDLPQQTLTYLMSCLNVEAEDLYECPGPLALSELMSLHSLPLDALKYEPFNPRLPRPLSGARSIFSILREQDLLIHHPYDSFYTVVELLNAAAIDPQVVAIKQTLYRVSGKNSPILDALIQAAENGKQVTVVVELKARFDEENNITWARRMERSGVKVVYGFVGLKTHAKLALIIRREEKKLRRYLHLSTGNYNWSTARSYCDIGLMSCDEDLCDDTNDLFNLLTGFNLLSDPHLVSGHVLPKFKSIAISPLNLRTRLLELIQREISVAQAGGEGLIVAKMNALVDKTIIDKLYEASQKGVEIELIVRGICCLRPGVAGLSEKIRVRSIVDRFLEHSRFFYFNNNGSEEFYLSSADWMPRNMDRRIEILFPVKSPDLKKRLSEEIMDTYLLDNEKVRFLNSDGSYVKVTDKQSSPIRAQSRFIEIARQRGVKSLPYEKAVRHNPELKSRPLARPLRKPSKLRGK